ncbi:type II toxin-antitoxin system VapC family toxin [Candidatus Pyrohabitans sp.]
MELLKKLTGKVIGIDTSPLIYFIESERFSNVVDPIFELIDKGECEGVTSTITLLEVLVQPYRLTREDLVKKYSEILLNSRNLQVYPVYSEIAIEAAKLRAKYGIRTPDAIQIATAIYAGAYVFITNDKRLKKVKEVEVTLLSELEKISPSGGESPGSTGGE